jgi:hypothetical protein
MEQAAKPATEVEAATAAATVIAVAVTTRRGAAARVVVNRGRGACVAGVTAVVVALEQPTKAVAQLLEEPFAARIFAAAT